MATANGMEFSLIGAKNRTSAPLGFHRQESQIGLVLSQIVHKRPEPRARRMQVILRPDEHKFEQAF